MIDKLERLISLKLWHLFKRAESKEVFRQNNMDFINLMNKMRVGKTNEDVGNNFTARFINQSHKDYPRNALYICAENQPTILWNQIILDGLFSEIYPVEVLNIFRII